MSWIPGFLQAEEEEGHPLDVTGDDLSEFGNGCLWFAVIGFFIIPIFLAIVLVIGHFLFGGHL